MLRFLTLCLLTTAVSPLALKRRVLVLPFDNTLKNRNYAWMSESIAESLKTEILKSGRFEVLDVTLLRRIDPSIQFANLDAKNASAFAQRLNCEVAVVGRFTVRKEGRTEIATFEADGVDALEKKSVVIKNESTVVNAEIFDTVGKLALSISDELNAKLAPLDALSFRRDNKLERLIRRLENPPSGFLDTLALVGAAGSPPLRFEPEFDIDTFEYDVFANYDQAEGIDAYALEYQYWGKRLQPLVSGNDAVCKQDKCTFTSRNPTIVVAKSVFEKNKVYTLRMHLPHPKGPLLSRWWVTAGYPYAKSISALGQSPEALVKEGGIPFDAMRGYGHLEVGFGTDRLQFGGGFKWALVTQLFYGQGILPQFAQDSGYTALIHMVSAGGGLRIDRPFFFGSRYGLSPFLGVYAHYQRFFREFSGGALNTMALVPEIGVNQYFSFGYKLRWRWVLTVAAGSFIYSGQNLSYARASVGVEYAFK